MQGINVCKVECESIKFMNCLKLFAFQGHRGGPYACKYERRIWTLVGIITSTFKEKSGLPCTFGFFTKVDQYLDFINKGDFKIVIIALFSIYIPNYSWYLSKSLNLNLLILLTMKYLLVFQQELSIESEIKSAAVKQISEALTYVIMSCYFAIEIMYST